MGRTPRAPPPTAGILQRWPTWVENGLTHCWSARVIIALHAIRYPGIAKETVRIDRVDNRIESWSRSRSVPTIDREEHLQRTLPVWMQFGGLPAVAELLYDEGRPPSSTIMTEHARMIAVQRAAQLSRPPGPYNTFSFGPNPEYDNEAILVTMW